VRVGILVKTEFRFAAPDYYYNLSGNGIGTGFGGVKEQLGPFAGESTLLRDWQLTALRDAFVEYVGDFPERAKTRSLFNPEMR
jgi:hypothetical protein